MQPACAALTRDYRLDERIVARRVGACRKHGIASELPTTRELVRANEFTSADSSRTIHDSSGFEAENRCVQCLSSAHRIKIFPQERDLAIHSSQEDHISWRYMRPVDLMSPSPLTSATAPRTSARA